MEKRLTFEGNFCDIAMCRENPCPYNGSCSQKETWERLKYYEDLLEQGRLVILPCKVGDDVWWIDDEEPQVKCDEDGVAGIAITKDGVRILDHHGDLDTIGTRYCYLTREDAEKALEEGNYE